MMHWKSLREEWPFSNDEVWLRWTNDGIAWHEKLVHEKDIDAISCLGIPEWRHQDPPEWMSIEQKEKFEAMKGAFQNRVEVIELQEYEKRNPI